MDKRLILAVAGSGKTTHIINKLSENKRSLLVTYTTNNYDNLNNRIDEKFEGHCPSGISVMTYFEFLYNFCYKPFLFDVYKTKGLCFDPNPNRFIKKDSYKFYFTPDRLIYSNRLSLLLEERGLIPFIQERITEFFDEFIIDEVQDLAGRDFSFLERLMTTDINMLFVGDFYQHTYDTSRDGSVNKTLHDDINEYIKRFTNHGFYLDDETLNYSWRCTSEVCNFISEELGINIKSNRTDHSTIEYITDPELISQFLSDQGIAKLHYQKSYIYGETHYNWGSTKGQDCYEDICVLLNKNTMKMFKAGKLSGLPPSTKNKLYVALTRAHGSVYLIEE